MTTSRRSKRSVTKVLAVLLTAILALAASPLSQTPSASAQDYQSIPTIGAVALSTPELSTLTHALFIASAAGPVNFVQTAWDPSADLTVFAPTNAAFDALGPALNDALADPGGALSNILLNHLVQGSQSGTDLIAAGTATTLLGQDLAVTTDADGNVFINDSQVVIADIQAANGIIHVIDVVLVPAATEPPPPPPAPRTIAEIAVATPELSTLVTALTVATDAGPVDFLSVASDPDADLTVFAPTNAAFDALGPALNDVLADPSGALTNILLYHVLDSAQTGADLVAAGTATTLLGDNVTITTDANGNVFINNSQVVIADIQAANGIIHVIDTVLLPPAPEEPSPIFDGARLHLINAESGRYLDGDVGNYGWRTNVDTSVTPRLDDEWILKPTRRGNWRLENAQSHLYLDADGRYQRYNVDQAPRWAFGTEWEIIELDNGNYVLRSVAYDRNLDWDRGNVDTSSNLELDNEWQIVLLNN